MKNQSIYQRAKNKGCNYETNCINCGSSERWDELMKGAREANQKKVVRVALLAGVISEAQARQELKQRSFNPYTHYVTPNYVVYVHSAVEHFIKVESK